MSSLNFEGMALAEGVVETIVAIAVQDVEGVASLGGSSAANPFNFKGKPAAKGVEVSADEGDTVSIAVRVDVMYGYALPAVADAIRQAVADAVATQIGIGVSRVDVYIDSIQFS